MATNCANPDPTSTKETSDESESDLDYDELEKEVDEIADNIFSTSEWEEHAQLYSDSETGSVMDIEQDVDNIHST